jgi:hypothetical protein
LSFIQEEEIGHAWTKHKISKHMGFPLLQRRFL